MAGEPGGQHAVEQVDAQGDGLHHPERVADAHEVAGPVLGQLGERGGQGGEHLVAALPHGQAAHGVAVEAHGHRALGALDPQLDVGAALHDAELGELGSLLGQEGASGQRGPVRGAVDGRAQHVMAATAAAGTRRGPSAGRCRRRPGGRPPPPG